MAAPRLCAVDGCDKPHLARGVCGKHYQRDAALGLHLPLKTQLDWLKDRLLYDGAECLIWPFTRDKNRYGRVGLARRMRWAHRVMCSFAHGHPPTSKHQAAHSCGNGSKGCVHPKHLRWATAKENAADRDRHGTMLRGSAVTGSVLSEAQVLKIYERALGGATQRIIAADYGVSRQLIGDIKTGRKWGWLTQSAHRRTWASI